MKEYNEVRNVIQTMRKLTETNPPTVIIKTDSDTYTYRWFNDTGGRVDIRVHLPYLSRAYSFNRNLCYIEVRTYKRRWYLFTSNKFKIAYRSEYGSIFDAWVNELGRYKDTAERDTKVALEQMEYRKNIKGMDVTGIKLK